MERRCRRVEARLAHGLACPNPVGGAAPNECADPASELGSHGRQRVSSGEDGANGGRVVASGARMGPVVDHTMRSS